MKHTPGPWSIDTVNRERVVKTIDGVYEYIADCIQPSDIPQDEQLANALLCAAAPEMYEALKTTLECLEEGGFGKAFAEDVARRVIAKAEGMGA